MPGRQNVHYLAMCPNIWIPAVVAKVCIAVVVVAKILILALVAQFGEHGKKAPVNLCAIGIANKRTSPRPRQE